MIIRDVTWDVFMYQWLIRQSMFHVRQCVNTLWKQMAARTSIPLIHSPSVCLGHYHRPLSPANCFPRLFILLAFYRFQKPKSNGTVCTNNTKAWILSHATSRISGRFFWRDNQISSVMFESQYSSTDLKLAQHTSQLQVIFLFFKMSRPPLRTIQSPTGVLSCG